jgi:hypothetical protein
LKWKGSFQIPGSYLEQAGLLLIRFAGKLPPLLVLSPTTNLALVVGVITLAVRLSSIIHLQLFGGCTSKLQMDQEDL